MSKLLGKRRIESEVPKLSELCFNFLARNVQLLRDVGDTDDASLKRIFVHCTSEQLRLIEDCTEGRDLSNITNDFWKVFFIKKHGKNEADVLFARMQKRNITCKWRSLFEYKEREKEAKEEQAIENLRRKNEEAKREAEKHKERVKRMLIAPKPEKRRKTTQQFTSGKNQKCGRLMQKSISEHRESLLMRRSAENYNKSLTRKGK